MMSTTLAFCVIFGLFSVIMLVSYLSSRKINSETFFTGNRRSPWYIVAFGMIGASISGITFISVPGEVGNSGWTYLQFIFGNFVGYWIIALIFIPLYYKLNLVSIYTYLDKRLGVRSYKTGSFFFIISQIIGSAFRLYLVVNVLQVAFFDALGIPFWVSVLITIFMIWLYTFKAGIKTVVWTDSLQTLFLIMSVVITLVIISKQFHFGLGDLAATISRHPYSRIFDWDWKSKTNFFKQFFAGLGMVIVLNGLNQNMIQKSLTCRNIKEAMKNIYWFSFAFIIVNVLFLSLGVMLYFYAQKLGIALPAKTDDLFPTLAFRYFGTFAGALFLLGIISAAYASADSALAALTSSFCVDFLNMDVLAPSGKRTRFWVHIGFSVIMFLVIIVFQLINNESVLTAVFKVAGYTYGPLLGFFAFGMLTKMQVKDKYVPYIGLLSPCLCYVISANSKSWFGGYKFGFELLLLNGLLTFIGLLFIMNKNNKH